MTEMLTENEGNIDRNDGMWTESKGIWTDIDCIGQILTECLAGARSGSGTHSESLRPFRHGDVVTLESLDLPGFFVGTDETVRQ